MFLSQRRPESHLPRASFGPPHSSPNFWKWVHCVRQTGRPARGEPERQREVMGLDSFLVGGEEGGNGSSFLATAANRRFE